jgi:hypothetical protein
MKKNHILLLSGFISGMLLGINGSFAQDAVQRKSVRFSPINICIAASDTYNGVYGIWDVSEQQFSINKGIFTPIQIIDRDGELTCRANQQYRTLKLYVAMPPRGQGKKRITVFKDQEQTGSYTISPGKQGAMMFDISGAKFFSIVVSCDTGSCSSAYLSQSQLETGSYNSGAREK